MKGLIPMNNFTSDELKTIYNALEFYKYEMNKTDNMDDYRAWKSARQRYNDHVSIHRGGYAWKESPHERVQDDC